MLSSRAYILTIKYICTGLLLSIYARDDNDLCVWDSCNDHTKIMELESICFLCISIGYFPFLENILRSFVSRSSRGLAFKTLQEAALSLVKTRRESRKQVKVHNIRVRMTAFITFVL